MTFYIGPDFRLSRLPGQVPKMDHTLDAMFQFPTLVVSELEVSPQRPMSGVDSIVGNLGLSSGRERLLRSIVSREIGSAVNEIALRQGLMQSLMEQKIEPELRRAVLSRAVSLFRDRVHVTGNVMPPHEQFIVKSTIDHTPPITPADPKALLKEIEAMLDEAGDIGISTSELTAFIEAHGSPAVVAALRKIGIQVNGKRITKGLFIKAEPEQLPRLSDIDDPRAAPVGARKIWNKRVVEKKADGHWHVVGHVAGLEDPKSVPVLQTDMLNKEALLQLLKQLIHIHQAEHPAGSEDGKEDKNA